MVAIAEAQRPKITSDDEGYWTLARALMGGCHIKWSPEPLPIIWFDVGLSQGRLHMYQQAGDSAHWFEGRIYLSQPLGFAARLASPAAPPLQPSFPNMVEVEDEQKDAELKLSGFSIETNAKPRLMKCLSADELRPLLKSLKAVLKLSSVEFIMAHKVFVIRGCIKDSAPPSELAERFGPQLVNWMRLTIGPLTEFSDRLLIKESELCPASAVEISKTFERRELWECHECGEMMYRVAMEVMKGCVNPHCESTVDGLSDLVLNIGRPHVEIKEVDPSEVGDHGWVSN